MQFRKVISGAIALWMSAGTTMSVSARDHPVGSTFRDLFRIDYTAARKTVPLPPGEWKLVSRNEYRSGTSNVPIVQFILLRHTETSVTGAISVLTHKELVNHQWGHSKLCSGKQRRVAWHIANEAYDGYEHCNVVYPVRGFNRRQKALRKTYAYIDELKLKGPNAWVRINFARVRKDEMMQAQFSLPPEQYGFPRERKYSNSESPWAINNIHDHPKKKAFMDKAVAWAKSWEKLIDQGFDNELRRATVHAHPRIDGIAALSPRKNPPARKMAKPVAPIADPVDPLPRQMTQVPPSPEPPLSDGPLKPTLVKKMIGGKTAFGQDSFMDNVVNFGRQGLLEGKMTQGSTEYEDSGNWSVDGSGRLCLEWNGQEFASNACFTTTKQQNKILIKDSTGKTAFIVPL
jgi:hypothetical protein